MEQHPAGPDDVDDLYAAATVGELRRLVNEIESRIVEGQHLATIGSLQVVTARAEDLANFCREAFHCNL